MRRRFRFARIQAVALAIAAAAALGTATAANGQYHCYWASAGCATVGIPPGVYKSSGLYFSSGDLMNTVSYGQVHNYKQMWASRLIGGGQAWGIWSTASERVFVRRYANPGFKLAHNCYNGNGTYHQIVNCGWFD